MTTAHRARHALPASACPAYSYQPAPPTAVSNAGRVVQLQGGWWRFSRCKPWPLQARTPVEKFTRRKAALTGP